MARILKGSHSFTCTPRIHPLTEWTIPAFAFPAKAGTHLPKPEGWKAELAYINTEIPQYSRRTYPAYIHTFLHLYEIPTHRRTDRQTDNDTYTKAVNWIHHQRLLSHIHIHWHHIVAASSSSSSNQLCRRLTYIHIINNGTANHLRPRPRPVIFVSETWKRIRWSISKVNMNMYSALCISLLSLQQLDMARV